VDVIVGGLATRRPHRRTAKFANAVKRGGGARRTTVLVKETTRTFYEELVIRAVRRVVANLDGALDLNALAREAALAPLHFHRIFRGMVGETPLELHRRLRLERAAMQLADGDAAVTTIAFDAGYETHETFTRAFGKAFVMSPSAFREDQRRAREACERTRTRELASPSGIHYARELDITFSPGANNMIVSIEQISDLRLATVHHTGPYDTISKAFARLGQLAGPAGIIRGDSKMIAVYHDDPESTPAAELRSDAAVSVPADAALPAGLDEGRIPGGTYAKTVHIGPYTGLGDAWSRFMGVWLPKSGRTLGGGAMFEVYKNTPENAKPEELVTELYVSVTDEKLP
jgi:AraC family transcriptional regulator